MFGVSEGSGCRARQAMVWRPKKVPKHIAVKSGSCNVFIIDKNNRLKGAAAFVDEDEILT